MAVAATKGHVVGLSPLPCWGGEENGKKKKSKNSWVGIGAV